MSELHNFLWSLHSSKAIIRLVWWLQGSSVIWLLISLIIATKCGEKFRQCNFPINFYLCSVNMKYAILKYLWQLWGRSSQVSSWKTWKNVWLFIFMSDTNLYIQLFPSGCSLFIHSLHICGYRFVFGLSIVSCFLFKSVKGKIWICRKIFSLSFA